MPASRSRRGVKRTRPASSVVRSSVPRRDQVVEVRDRFADGEEALLRVELAPEQHRHDVGRGPRAGARRRRAARRAGRRDARAAARREPRCRETAVRATAGPACRRGSASNARSESRNRASGSPSGSAGQTETFVLMRGSSMSPLISTRRSGAMQGRVLGRMSVAADHAPVVAADADRRAGMQPPEARRKLRNARAIAIAARRDAPARARPSTPCEWNSAQVSVTA